MLRCFSLQSADTENRPSSSLSSLPPRTTSKSLPNSPIAAQSSSPQPSPTINLSDEYSLAVQTKSYNEIWSKIHTPNPDDQTQFVEHHLVNQVLHPNRQSVDQALHQTRPTTLNRLISTYFQNSEETSRLLCILLHHSLTTARLIYTPLHDLLEVLPLDSSLLSQRQCDHAFEIFLQFNNHDNPFPDPVSQNFQTMRGCFSQLKNQLDHRLHKARRRSHLFRTSSFCLSSIAKGPLHLTLPSKFVKKQIHRIAQLDAAAKGAYVLNNDLDTIDRLVARLHAAVESDKMLVGIGLERGKDRYPIQEVVKQLRKNHPNFLNQLKDLEEHVCLCFTTVNRARSLLLQEIHQQQTCNS